MVSIACLRAAHIPSGGRPPHRLRNPFGRMCYPPPSSEEANRLSRLRGADSLIKPGGNHLNSLEKAVAPASNGRSKGAAKKQNPLKVFEAYAKQIWSSDRSYEDKAARLRRLGKSIDDYVLKLNAHLEAQNVDAWTTLSVNRSKAYLTQLADDVRKLATETPMDFSSKMLGRLDG